VRPLLSEANNFVDNTELGLKKLNKVSGGGPSDFFFFVGGPSPVISPLNDFPNNMDDG
jgi:hypothetical protein